MSEHYNLLDAKRLRTLYQRILNRIAIKSNLCDFYFSTFSFESLLQGFSFFFGNAFLQLAGSSVNQILSFLQAKTARFLNSLNNLQFSCACILQNNIERCLFFSGGSTTNCGTSSNSNSSCSGFNAILVLEDLCQFVNFFYCQIYQFFSKSFNICHFIKIFSCF